MASFARVLAMAALVMLCGAEARAQGASTRANPFLAAKSWAYQLNNLGPAQQARIAASPYDLVVIDYARSEVGERKPEMPLTREEVARMKVKPDGGKRLIIAYLSIGESEDNRYYWGADWSRHRPAWMGAESKEWKGNYLVKYWEPVWQNIIFGNAQSYVDRILAAGFDGFYLDRADAYYRFGDTKEARDNMSALVIKIADYIRSKKPDAAIMMQNAEELLERADVVAAIDAIAKEDLVWGITHREELNKQDDIDESTALLKSAQKAGKAIFVVEYLKNAKNIEEAKRRMADLGFVLYYGPRGLFELPGTTPAAATAAGAPPARKRVTVQAKKKAAAKAKAQAKAN